MHPSTKTFGSTTFIHRLPDELVCEIFLYACDGLFRLCIESSCRLPLQRLLCLVCKRWNNVASRCAGLWTSIEFVARQPHVEERPSSVFVDVMRHALACSGVLSINVNVSIEEEPNETMNIVSAVIHELVHHSDRWTIAKMHLTGIPYDLLLPLQGRIQRLTCLWFHWSPPRAETVTQAQRIRLSPIFVDAPNLTRVQHCTLQDVPFEFPLSQLTELSVYTFSHPSRSPRRFALFPFLDMARNFRGWSMQWGGLYFADVDAESAQQSPVTNTHITQFHIEDHVLSSIVTLPSLTDISVTPRREKADATFAALRSLAARSRCRIKRVKLCGFEVAWETSLLGISDVLGEVEHLEIVDDSWGSDFHADTVLKHLSSIVRRAAVPTAQLQSLTFELQLRERGLRFPLSSKGLTALGMLLEHWEKTHSAAKLKELNFLLLIKYMEHTDEAESAAEMIQEGLPVLRSQPEWSRVYRFREIIGSLRVLISINRMNETPIDIPILA